jgi:phosphoesterase RecJ-like protein
MADPNQRATAELELIGSFIHKHHSFAITTHINPEADALGSQLALRLILKVLNKEVVAINRDNTPHNLLFLEGASEILKPPDIEQRPAVWFVVDCGNLERVGEEITKMIKDKRIINIDHHENTMFGEVNYVRKLASTAQLIYELAKHLKVKITKEMATCIYAGIVADTDSFRNANTSGEVLKISAELINWGANPREVAINLYERRRLSELRLLGLVLLEAQVWNGIIWSVITKDSFAQAGASVGDTERVVEELRTMEGIKVAVLFKELEKGIKVSLRSKEGIDVSEIAAGFGGGGHERAAGFLISGDLEEIKEIVLEEVKRRL